MNGREKSLRLCVVFVLSGLLTLLCLARSSIVIPPGISQYLDIVMAVLMVVLLLCVLELCLGVELCGVICSGRHSEMEDPERRGGDTDPSTVESSEAPPSYDSIMAQGRAETHVGAAEGPDRGRERESVPLKRAFSFHFKSPTPDEERLPPVRPPSASGYSETSFVSPGELWLAVDGLPTYEEAVARLREAEEVEVVMAMQEGEAETLTQQQEAGLRQQDIAEWFPVAEEAGQAGRRGREGMGSLLQGEVDSMTQQKEEEAR